MPIYDYQCRDCGHVFDALQKLSDAPLVQCPECGAAALQKLLSAPNFQLKGSGWRKPRAELKQTVKRGHMFDQASPHADHTGAPGNSHESGGDHPPATATSHDHDTGHSHSHSHPHGHSHGPGHSHDH